MQVGDVDGFGRYGILEETSDRLLLCVLCGSAFARLGLHIARGHGGTAAVYRLEHGLSRSRGLISADIRAKQVANAAASETTQRGAGRVPGHRLGRPCPGREGPAHVSGRGSGAKPAFRCRPTTPAHRPRHHLRGLPGPVLCPHRVRPPPVLQPGPTTSPPAAPAAGPARDDARSSAGSPAPAAQPPAPRSAPAAPATGPGTVPPASWRP